MYTIDKSGPMTKPWSIPQVIFYFRDFDYSITRKLLN